MLHYELDAYGDVDDPTDEELAEVDAAIDRARRPSYGPAAGVLLAWVQSYPVLSALRAVGEPDGTTRWWLDFTAHLLAITDAVGEITSEVDADRMLELATLWHHATGRAEYRKGHQMPTEILREMVDMATIPVVAHYIDAPPMQVARWLFPRSHIPSLLHGEMLYRRGVPLRSAAYSARIWHGTLAAWLRAWRVPTPVVLTIDGRRVMPPEVADRIRELAAEGHKAAAVLATVREEFPQATEHLAYSAVNQMIYRHRRAA